MTLLVGILCSDGVVLASDSFATASDGQVATLGQQRVEKVVQLSDGLLYASTGAIGMAQVVAAALREQASKSVFVRLPASESPSVDVMTAISATIRTALQPHMLGAIQAIPLLGDRQAGTTVLVKSLVAAFVKKKACLFQFDHHGAPEEATPQFPFVALGSGQPIADPFLALLKRVLWADGQPSVAEGRFAAAWAVWHVCKTNPGGVGLPMQIATLTVKDGKPNIKFSDEGEHFQALEGVETALRAQVVSMLGGASLGAESSPPVPPS